MTSLGVDTLIFVFTHGAVKRMAVLRRTPLGIASNGPDIEGCEEDRLDLYKD